ncbi:MAG: polysaccharide deacetylase family protein [Bacillota bacterium]|nr:polysaccharide deacetylase family protein [Bacillota bacterium]
MKKFWIILIILLALCGMFYAFTRIYDTDVYKNSEEFREFADNSLAEEQFFTPDEYTQTEYEYDKKLSFAIRKDQYSGEDISKLRDNRIKDIVKSFIAKQAVEGDDRTRACIIDSTVRDWDNEAQSLAICVKTYVEQDREMVLEDTDIKTFLISLQTGEEIKPIQAFNINYRAKASKFAADYFTKTYSPEVLNEDWEKYIADNDENFNKFMMTDSAVIFYFDEGTVADESEGILSMTIPRRNMLQAIRPLVIDRYIDPDKPMIAITYDDGPGGASEARILDCLEKHGSVATFFYMGNRMEGFGETARRAAQMGCEIGNHSWSHPQLSLLSKKKIKEQLEKTNDAIYEVTGTVPDVCRPPYGDYSDKVVKTIGSEDMYAVLWTIDTLDWKTRNPKKIFKSVKNTKNLDGKIILMHSIYDETAKASEKIIPWLEEQGYQTVTISELIKYKTGKTPQEGKLYRSFP